MLIKCFFNLLLSYYFFLKLSLSLNPPYMFKCLKDTIKIENICAMEGTATIEDEESLILSTTNYLYINEECDPDERCKPMGLNAKLYQCFPKVEKLKIGDKCSVNEECETGLCTMDLCQGIDFEGDCSDYKEACKPGLFCTYNSIFEKYTCEEYSYLHEICGEGDWGYFKQCFKGLGCHLREDGSGKKVCKKWGTVLLNRVVDDERLCETGMAMIDTDGYLKCISVEEDGECDETNHKCTPTIVGLGEDADITEDITMDCVGGFNNMYTCPLGVGKNRLFRNYINEYNELYDIDKLKKNQNFKEGYFNEPTLTELYIKYKQYEYLRAYEIIDFEGNVNGIYSCEYDFVWTFIDSKYIKPNFIIMLFLLIIFILR